MLYKNRWWLAAAVVAVLTAGAGPAARAQVARPEFDPDKAKVGFEIGDLAPEIEGQDLDGVKFKLGDYRGKVVVLDFWGNW